MQRIIATLALVAIMIVLLAGCTPKKYQYIDGDAYDYAILNEKQSKYNGDNLDSVDFEPQIYAESMDELIAKVKNGNFTDMDYRYFSRMRKDDQGRIILPDLDNLLEVTHPDDIQWNLAKFYDAGEYCYIHIGDGNQRIIASIGTEKHFDIDFQRLLDRSSSAVITDSSTAAEIEEVRSLLYDEYWNGDRGYRYQVHKDSTVHYVYEYRISTDDASGEHSTYSINIYRKISDDLYLKIVTEYYDQLSVDWLTSFSVTPYGE